MNITRENVDALNATIKIAIAKADYEEKVEKTLKDYKRTASIKGFRPGHVPYGMIKKLYGTAVMVDEINKLVSESLSNYITEEKLEILGDPMPKNEGQSFDPENDDNFTFNFEVGLAPEFENTLSNKCKLTRYQIEPDRKMIDDYKENYCRRHGEFTVAEESEEKDMLRGTLTSSDGSVFKDDSTLSVAQVKDENIKKEFIGKKSGDRIVFDIRAAFPNDYEIASLTGKQKEETADINGDFVFVIHEVSRFVPATPGPELYEKIWGADTVTTDEEFEGKVVDEIKEYFNRETDYKLKTDARELALEKMPFDLPDEFLKRWLVKVNEKTTAEEIEKEYDHFRDDLRWQLIKNKIAKENTVKIEEEEILEEAKAFTKAQFMQYGLYQVTDEQVTNFAREMLKKEDDARRIAEKVLDTRVLNLIIDAVQVSDKKVTIEEFNKLFEKK
ncbi:MAG TPA: trigger factor [Bacteroidales bacterium]|nr:trigger factor [Bacteroidales bacterium]HPT11695.1 trigger factor [Bacteroidales bacterium]